MFVLHIWNTASLNVMIVQDIVKKEGYFMEERLEVIAKIYTEFTEKFGIPRQSGLVSGLRAKIIFEQKYRNPDVIRGIEEFSHLWLIWNFHKAKQQSFHATVAPPRLGGKEKKGIFATRSPFRPNSLGLSSVKLEEIVYEENLGPVLIVSGADLLNETPIYDIKPYLPYTDSHPEASGSFGEIHKTDTIQVEFPKVYRECLPEYLRESAQQVLEQDPRAAFHKKEDYVYGLAFGGYDIRFRVSKNKLTVCGVEKQGANKVK